MSSKIGTILSLIFVAMFVVLGCDIMSIQFLYSDIDAKSTTISYLISKNGRLDEFLIYQIEHTYNVEFTCVSANCNSAKVGDIIEYQLSIQYQPIIVSKNKMTISVQRQAVLGYYS